MIFQGKMTEYRGMFKMVYKNQFVLSVYKTVTLFVVILLVFAPAEEWLAEFAHIDLNLPDIKAVLAATGDFATFSDTGQVTISAVGTPLDLAWNTTINSNSNLALQPNSSDIDLADGGKYLVLYNAFADEGTAGGTNRRSVNTYLTLAGTPLAYGRSAGLSRDSEAWTNSYSSGSAIIAATAGDDLQLHIQRDDNNTGAGLQTQSGANGVSTLKLPEGADYLRARKVATSSSISGDISFTGVPFDTADEVDTGSFGFTPTSSSFTLNGSNGDLFIVNVNVGIYDSANSATRQNYEMRLTLDGTEIPGTRVTSYLRGTNGTWNGQLSYTGLIAKTAAGSQTLVVQVRRESSTSATTVITGNKTSISMMAVPNTAEVIRLTDSSGTQTTSNTATELTFNTNDEVDTTAFSHSTSTNPARIEIDQAGDYLFFSTAHTGTVTSGNNRQPFRMDWRLTGVSQGRGSYGAPNRANGTFAGGASGGILMSGLSTSDYITLAHTDETNNTPVDATFGANRVAVQGILLNDNFFGLDTIVSASGTQATSANIPTKDVYVGGNFLVQEQSATRNVTNVTINESGSINGSTGLNNIRLYYDLDTTTPYDCSSESFTGTTTENQFGSTDTNGFSGADGSSSFNATVSISPTQALCLYPVVDVLGSASDGQTIEISINNPVTDVTVTGGASLGPNTAQAITGSTTVRNAELTQTHYNWRNDNGSETAATSIDGTEDTPAIGFANGTTRRLRLGISNEGSINSADNVSILDNFTTGNTKTISAGSERLLLVGIHSEDTGSNVNINTVSYGGQTLTEIRDEQITTTASNGMWVGYLTESQIAAASGNTITPTWTGGTPDTAVLYSSVVLENVNQGTPISGWSANGVTSASSVQPTTTIPVSIGDRSVYFTVSGATGQTHSEPGDYNEGTEQDASGAVAANAEKTITANGTEQPIATWSGTNNRLAIVAFGVNVSPNVVAPQRYRLEYATKVTTCSAASGWTDVGTGGSGDWGVIDTGNLTDGNDTTNVTLQANGGISDPAGHSFLSVNGGQKDTSSETGDLVLAVSEFTELEFAIEPTSGAPQGSTYCFRLSDSGIALRNYSNYAVGTISADIDVSATSSHVASLDVGSTNQYLGGGFVIERSGTNRTVTSITLTEVGTVDAQNNLNNISLLYDLDTVAPYDCTGESYSGGETPFGSTDVDGFSGANGTSTFTGSVVVNSTTTMCLYVELDVGSGATNGETILVEINDPAIDVVVTGSSVGPSTSVAPTGSTTIVGPIRTQTHYHWRNDDGDETDTGATSASGGAQDTVIIDVPQESTRRLRLQVSNEGSVTTAATTYRLEYGTRITTCDAVASWVDVGIVGGAWNMSTSTFISDGNTTNIAEANGGMTDENSSFSGTGALRENSSESGSITLTSTGFTELEYSIEATVDSGFNTTYCFRVSDAGSALESYTTYAELTTREKQDFYIQRASSTVTGTTLTLTAGVDYVAPAATSSAFVRITNSQLTGAGTNAGGGNQNSDDFTAYISDQSDITSSFTIGRPVGATGNTRVDWEIIEFVGTAGTDNEMVVRDVGTFSTTATNLVATGTISTSTDDVDIVVFITGQYNDDAGRTNPNDGLFTAAWSASTDEPVFIRAEGDSNAGGSYAVVEFTGANWSVERVEHTYITSTSTETENITAIPSVTKAFVHAQKRVGGANNGLDEQGHQVWISSIGAVSFQLRSGATTPSAHVSVAWVISNTQTGNGGLATHQTSGIIASGGPEPNSNSINIGATVNPANSSIFATNVSNGTGTALPRGFNGYIITSATTYELWQSDTGQNNDYRADIIEWPVAETALRQSYYRFYVDNDALDPVDPWPLGASDLGENTSITASDDPMGEGERIRIRMTMRVSNATLPAAASAFKLQFGLRTSSCSAIAIWNDLGDPGDGTIWRGYNGSEIDGTALATSTPAPGTLNISVSDVAGTYEEQNNTAINPFLVDIGQDVEYDWLIEHNGAAQESDYCFRMVKSDGTELAGYNNYPTLKTTGYTPVISDWRWYGDEVNATPTTTLAATNTAPTDIANEDPLKLRVIVAEVENAAGTNIKFRLQYSERADFSDGGNFVVASSSCTATSTWCYVDGGGVDNATIATAVIGTADLCVAQSGNGCGTHNEFPTTTSSHGQPASSNMEFEYTIIPAGPRVGTVYYFRLFDVNEDQPLVASSTFPSLVTESGSLVFTVSGVGSGQSTEGVVTDVATTPTSIPFGTLPFDTDYNAAYRLTVNVNATEGYQMFMYANQDMLDGYGNMVVPISGTNDTPVGWATGCSGGAVSCVGYHVGDDALSGGSTRFSPNDSYAAISTTTPEEVMFSSQPVANESSDLVLRIRVSDLQPAGLYQNDVIFISVPVF